MKKLDLFFIAVFLLFALPIISHSQTLDEVINNYANAMGGSEKLMGIKSVKYSGKFSDGGADIPLTMNIKRDGKARREMSYQGMNMIRASDGTMGWVINPYQGTKEAMKMPYEELKDMKKYAEIEGELINYKQKGYKADYLGKDDFEGSEVYKIRLTDKEGDITYYYLDVSTYLLLREINKRKIQEKEVKSETIYGNYQKIDGIMFPMAYETIESGNPQVQKITLDKVEINVDVDDDIFMMPDAKQ